MPKTFDWFEDMVARDANGWRKHPRLSIAVAVALLIAGVVLVVFDISRVAGNVFLVGFLVEIGIWLTRVRGKPAMDDSSSLPKRERFWKEHPAWWWFSCAFLGFMTVAGILTFLFDGSYFALGAGTFLGLLVSANIAIRVAEAIRPEATKQ